MGHWYRNWAGRRQTRIIQWNLHRLLAIRYSLGSAAPRGLTILAGKVENKYKQLPE